MKKVFLFIFMFVLCGLGKAQNDRWTFIGTSDEANNVTAYYYVDNSSLKYSSKYGVRTCHAWIKTVFLGDEKRDYEITYDLLNCDEKSDTILRYTIYFHDKTYLNNDDYYRKDYVIPDSIGEDIFNYICK